MAQRFTIKLDYPADLLQTTFRRCKPVSRIKADRYRGAAGVPAIQRLPAMDTVFAHVRAGIRLLG